MTKKVCDMAEAVSEYPAPIDVQKMVKILYIYFAT